jgi:hypothetical protein
MCCHPLQRYRFSPGVGEEVHRVLGDHASKGREAGRAGPWSRHPQTRYGQVVKQAGGHARATSESREQERISRIPELGFVRKHDVREVTIHWDACSSPFSYREWLNN